MEPMNPTRTITSATDARTLVADGLNWTTPAEPGSLVGFGAADLRKLARQAVPSLPGIFASQGTADVLVDVLEGRSAPSAWSIDGGTGRFVRTPSAAQDPTPAPAPVDPSAKRAIGSMEELLGTIAREALSAELDAVRAEIDERIRELGAVRPLVIEAKGREPITIAPGEHVSMERLARAHAAGFQNVYLYGPAGTGKSTLCERFADLCGAPFAQVSCAPGMDESALEGFATPNVQTGANVWNPSEFARLWTTEGAHICLDELDRANPAVSLMLNNALARSGRFNCVPAAQALARAAGVFTVGAGNSKLGGPDSKYVAAERQDGALVDRFRCATFFVDYDVDLERRIMRAHELSEAQCDSLASATRIARDTIKTRAIGEDWSTRAVEGACLWLRAGEDLEPAIGSALDLWSDTDADQVRSAWRSGGVL